MLVQGEKSSPLISIIFRKKTGEEEIIFSPGFENRSVVFVSQIYSISSKPGVIIIPTSLQLLWSERQARACCPGDPGRLGNGRRI